MPMAKLKKKKKKERKKKYLWLVFLISNYLRLVEINGKVQLHQPRRDELGTLIKNTYKYILKCH